uniref:Uncharacterized protein n=1 Tax=Naja naja TaxID=35670 RepID=A0A8C7E640_NAJNA
MEHPPLGPKANWQNQIIEIFYIRDGLLSVFQGLQEMIRCFLLVIINENGGRRFMGGKLILFPP